MYVQKWFVVRVGVGGGWWVAVELVAGEIVEEAGQVQMGALVAAVVALVAPVSVPVQLAVVVLVAAAVAAAVVDGRVEVDVEAHTSSYLGLR